MKIALNDNGKRIDIDEARIDETYYCPICHQPLLQKRGQVKAFHFAHHPSSDCLDHWHYDMSAWHYTWQDRYASEEQEIVKEFLVKTHRADVLLEVEKTVIEFQHSEISISEFEDRNHFYNQLGYRVIWVFDMMEEYQRKDIFLLDEKKSKEKYFYRYPKKIFASFDYRKEDVILFFQIAEEDIRLLKVTWTSPKGIYRFCADEFSLDEFLSFSRNEKMEVVYPKSSIPYLLHDNQGVPIIVRNKDTREEYLVSPHAMDDYGKYHHIYGKTSNSFGEYHDKSVPIHDAMKPCWVIIWKPKKK